MLDFNPGEQDRSSGYIYNALEQNADYAQQNQLAQKKQNQENIATAMDAVSHFTKEAKTNAAVAGGIDAFTKVAKNYGMSDEYLADLHGEKNPAKAAAKLLVYQSDIDGIMQARRAQQQIDAQLGYQRQKAAIWAANQGARPVNPNLSPLAIPDLPSDIDTSQ